MKINIGEKLSPKSEGDNSGYKIQAERLSLAQFCKNHSLSLPYHMICTHTNGTSDMSWHSKNKKTTLVKTINENSILTTATN